MSVCCAVVLALLGACANGSGRPHDAHVATDGGGAHDSGFAVDAFAPPMDASSGVDAASPDDAATVDVDAGHDAAVVVLADAGHDAAVVLTDAGGSGSCALTHLVISEVRTRGAGGAGDEFVELFNPTSAAVILDANWSLEARSTSATSYTARWTGSGASIGAHGHYLIAGTGYTQTPSGDAALSSGITDAGSLRLQHSGATVDALCFAFSATTAAAFDATFTCEGAPFATQPHDNTTATNVDASLERLAGGAAGSCTDTDDNASDFVVRMPADPQSTTSTPTP